METATRIGIEYLPVSNIFKTREMAKRRVTGIAYANGEGGERMEVAFFLFPLQKNHYSPTKMTYRPCKEKLKLKDLIHAIHPRVLFMAKQQGESGLLHVLPLSPYILTHNPNSPMPHQFHPPPLTISLQSDMIVGEEDCSNKVRCRIYDHSQ
jgi:hypothetical protein